jgi:coenzyme F420-reducing hydrogenase delta subunit/Pyruvate/2-oxoacid:ferredoxin oxidoreductase delta subunit
MKHLDLDSHVLACDVLVIGDGRGAADDTFADRLVHRALRVISVCPISGGGKHVASGGHILHADLLHCEGYTGAYHVDVADGEQHWSIRTAAIVVALDEQTVPEYDAYGLVPGQRVHTISDADLLLSRGAFAGSGETVVLLNGLVRESHPAISGRMVNLCIRLQQQQSDLKTVLITANLKVAARGLEADCHAARRLGTFFHKLDARPPDITVIAQGRVQFAFYDPLLRRNVEITADHVIVDERIIADERIAQIAAILGLHTDAFGYGQADNVRRLTHLTNRRGIFAAGATRGVLSDEERLADEEALCVTVNTFLTGTDRSQLPEVRIDAGLCGRCLTCHRTCPYMAIDIGDRMTVVADACQACGLCVAACPAKAIQMQGSELTATLRIESGGQVEYPRIVAFCCQRSAAPAFEAAGSAENALPHGLIRVLVPCGGRIATNDIAAAFEAEADGVMVLTCHDDNCHSHTGSRTARKRAEGLRDDLSKAGIAPERVYLAGIAANMGTEIAHLSIEFETRLRTLKRPDGAPADKKE